MTDIPVNEDLTTAARILLEGGAKEVYVFGSAAHGEPRSDSDLDLAVRGLPADKFFRVMSAVTFAVSRPVDLVDLDEENPFTEFLEREGELRRVA